MSDPVLKDAAEAVIVKTETVQEAINLNPDKKSEPKIVAEADAPKEKKDYSREYTRPYYSNPWTRDNDYMQLSHMTSEERFPLIFDSAKTLQPNAKRVLSFGCSTGEECKALAKRFPNAEIMGVDIDWGSVQTARRRNKNCNVSFHTDLEGVGKFDVVLALMVFFSMEKPIDFKMFSKSLNQIHRHLNPEGVLMVYTSDYDPASIPAIAQYKPLNVWMRVHNKNSKTYYNGYYRKRSDKEMRTLLP